MTKGRKRTPINKLRTEYHIGVLKHALFQRHDYELRMLKVVFDHCADVLRVAQVKRRIHLSSRPA